MFSVNKALDSSTLEEKKGEREEGRKKGKNEGRRHGSFFKMNAVII